MGPFFNTNPQSIIPVSIALPRYYLNDLNTVNDDQGAAAVNDGCAC